MYPLKVIHKISVYDGPHRVHIAQPFIWYRLQLNTELLKVRITLCFLHRFIPLDKYHMQCTFF